MPKSTTEFTNEGLGTAQLTENDRYQLLSDERRRILLDVLDGRTTPIELEELAAAVAAQEGNDGTRAADSHRRVATTLHHNHLPRMAALGLIDYDRESRRVRTS